MGLLLSGKRSLVNGNHYSKYLYDFFFFFFFWVVENTDYLSNGIASVV